MAEDGKNSLKFTQSKGNNSSITDDTKQNNFECSHKVHFSKTFFRKNIKDFTNLHNEKNKSGSFM